MARYVTHDQIEALAMPADSIPLQGTKVSVRMSREHCIGFPIT
jgi:hypothetical protein